MNTQTRSLVLGVMLVATLALLVLAAGFTNAQGAGPGDSQPLSPDAIAPGAIPIQGRLTNASGAPLNGVYTLTFRLYDSASAVIATCADVRGVSVANGLFSDYMDHCYDDINGQKLWLGIQVGSDAEMLPRQVIFPVPYALSLVPGAVISSNSPHASTVLVRNTSTTGTALEGSAPALSGQNNGVAGYSGSPEGHAGHFWNSGGGVGVWGVSVGGAGVYAGSLGTALVASSGAGASIAAIGSGIITSTAKSYLWISGNGLRAFHQSDSTVIDMDTVGGAIVKRGAPDASTRNVMLPITALGPLYGQNVRITAMDINWVADTDFDGIVAVLMRRQTGVCDTTSCYASIINDHPVGGLSCEDGVHPTGCTQHYAPASNNVLSSNSGVLYLTLELTFNSDTSWVRIGAVKLTLEHD